MSTFVWPSEDGWPYPDTAAEWVDPETAADDDDLLSVRFDARLLDGLDPLERQVLSARYGLDGHTVRTVGELHDDLGMSTGDVETLLASGLTKLRTRLA
ncbi:MAG TPA: sigma factor-like helix-turn-helix DNA-binding protein [Acidimicrobiales bacterium]|jgi:DNA-directed RNA polymerase sigma subunit (sigma70/sigma32)|nr:sigma factor-like helix-turn-helix DNA-binding protein [Acidimicrobiales bacterium]